MDRPREPSLSLSLSLSLPPSRSLCPPVSPWLAISFPPSTSVSQSCSTPVRVHSLSTFYYSISLYLGLLHLSFSRPLPFVLSLYSPGVPLHLSLKHLFIPLLRYLLYGSLSPSLRHSLVFSTKTSAPYLSQRGTAPRVTHPRSSLSLCFSLLYESAHEARARAFIHT